MRLPHSLRREVVEVVLHQLGQVVAEVDLELGVELAGLSGLDLSDGVRGEDLGGGLPDDPGAVVIPGNNADRQREESVSATSSSLNLSASECNDCFRIPVENVYGLTSWNLHILYVLPGLC